MKPNTIRFVAIVSGLYIMAIVLLRSVIPEATSPTVSLLALPLVLLALVLVFDLSDRATLPTRVQAQRASRRFRASDVRFLTRQVEVAARASPAYFETILRSRLRELLAERVSLETGLDKSRVNGLLESDRTGGPLLGDFELYKLLYHAPPRGASERLQLLRRILDHMEGWNA